MLAVKAPLRVTIAIDGPYPTALKLAGFLASQGCLERLVTTMPRFRVPWIGVPDQHLVRLWPLAYLAYVSRRAPVVRDWAPRMWYLCEWFDRLASVRMGECSLFNGWCCLALHSMRRARDRGKATVLQMGSIHLETQTELLRTEYARLGLRPSLTDPRLVEKAVQEYAEADHLVVPSTLVKRSLIEKGIAPERVSIVPEVTWFARRPHAKTDDTFRVTFVGLVDARKGVVYLLEAFRRLRLRNSELVLVGGIRPEMKPILERYVGMYQARGYLKGDALNEAYARSSVVVVPSVEDGWGLVTLEAMSCGRPVVVSSNVGSTDAVVDGVTGFVVPPRDVEALMERIELLYRDPELASEMGRQGRARASGWNRTAYGKQMLDIFRNVQQGIKLLSSS